MVVIVGCAALGREVHDELGRIQRGERPSDHEVRKQWDEIIAEGRARWAGVREQVERRRAARREGKAARAARADGPADEAPDAPAVDPVDAAPSGEQR